MPADTETSGGSENSGSGLDVTLLVFIIIIAVLVLGLIVILLVYWCCRPGRREEREEERQQINNIQTVAGQLEKEVTRAGLGLAGVEQSVARLEQRVESSSAGQQEADKAQVRLGAQQDRLTEEARRINHTVEQLREKLRKVQLDISG